MAENFDFNKVFRTSSITKSLHCQKCHRLVVMCSCNNLQSPAFIPDANFLDDCFLDIDSIEVEQGYDPSFDRIENNPIPYRRQAAVNPGSDLNVLAPMCAKSHYHHAFIDVDNFSINHLPPSIQHPCTYVWIRNCAPLVVRLIRNVTATGRACLLSHLSGQTIECNKDTCPNEWDQDHMLYGGIGIITNKHVITNDLDASETKIEFFYNDVKSRKEMLITEYGASMVMTNIHMDYTVFSCFVHFEELITLVDMFDKRRNCSWLAIPREIREASKKFAIIISHPHGASKKISIGDFVEQQIQVRSETQVQTLYVLRSIYDTCDKVGYGEVRFGAYLKQLPDLDIPHTVTWYTTATCKGSSGAPVYMGNVVEEDGLEINQAHTHRGVDNDKGFNNCFT